MSTKSSKEQLYHIVAINERTRRRETVTSYPLDHSAACRLKGKFTPHKDVRLQLSPVSQHTTGKGTVTQRSVVPSSPAKTPKRSAALTKILTKYGF